MGDAEAVLKAWELYYPAEEYTVFNSDVATIIGIRKKIEMSTKRAEAIAATRVYRCSYEEYTEYAGAVCCISCAVSELVYEKTGELVAVETRIEGVPSASCFARVSADSVGKLVGLVGTVSRVGYRRIESLEAVFECAKCAKKSRVRIKDNIYRLPACSCRGKTQVFLHGHPDNRCVDRQTVRLQELHGGGNGLAAVDVELSGSFVGTVAPGDTVEVVGLVASELIEDAYRLKIECNNMRPVCYRSAMREGDGAEEGDESILVLSEEQSDHGAAATQQPASTRSDFELFTRLSEEPALMEMLTAAFYGAIVGHESIKRGLVLALFGGTRKYVGAKATRAEIHVLVVGDPGLGKSRLLVASAAILPKSTVVSGSFCTTAGLTVSITHDPCSGEYMADAGALVVSDGGVCCVDEFDKVDDHTALLEVMEDQLVSVAKGGVVCAVPTRPTVVAAANPKFGHFDPTKSLRENLRFDGALLSRFDLTFILQDNLSEGEDRSVFDQILRTRVGAARAEADEEQPGAYSRAVLKAYVEYARINVHPRLSRAAKALVKEYYLSIRPLKHVGIRNLESIARLTEAVAKMQLRTVASAGHARYAISLYKAQLIREEQRQPKRRAGVEDALREYADRRGPFISKEDLVQLVEEAQVKRNPYEYIELLNCKGVVL
ncbi:DNA helicase MCM8, partial [Pancytospora philotis]